MSCRYVNPSIQSLDLERFDRLHTDGKRLIRSWFDRALRKLDCPPQESFEPFIFCWIAFNAWASCVTDEDRDSDMIRQVANCSELRMRFLRLYHEDRPFKMMMDSFMELWPIFKAQEIRRHGIFNTTGKTREEIVAIYLGLGNVNYAPDCWRYHLDRSEHVPIDWSHSIHTIYRIRCNLFHGEKSPHSEMDANIVKKAFDVLVNFLNKAEIIICHSQ